MAEWHWQGKTPDFVHQISLAFLPAESYSSTSGCLGKGNEFKLRRIFVHTSKWYFTCRKILQHGASGFTSPLKKGLLRIVIVLKNPSPRPGLNTRTLGPMASTLTITPPRRLSYNIGPAVYVCENLPLKAETVCFSETLVSARTCNWTRRHNPGDHHRHSYL
jgi:hypothetical protein